jgi:hypothetical protein
MNAPCMDCGALVEVSAEALRYVSAFNGVLHRRRERQLGADEVARCAVCYRRWDGTQKAITAAKLREYQEATWDVQGGKRLTGAELREVLDGPFGGQFKAILAALRNTGSRGGDVPS